MTELPDLHACLPQRPPVIGRHPGDGIPGTTVAVGRSLLTEAYDSPPNIPWNAVEVLPDGILRLPLTPLGQLGEYWFVADDPIAIYAIPFGVFLMVGAPVVIEHVKNYAAKERNR